MSTGKKYKDERLEDQIKWHSQKTRYNKSMFRLYQIITLIASASIPIVNVIDQIDLNVRIITSIKAGIIAVVSGISQLERYQENWILYRTTTELLKKEKYFFESNAGEYSHLDEDEKNQLLVERVESIVSVETSKYFTIHHNQKDEQEQNQKYKLG